MGVRLRRLTPPSDGPFRGAVVTFSAQLPGTDGNSVDLADCPVEAAFGAAQLTFRFVDGANEIVAFGSDEGLGQRRDALAKASDVVGDGRQFRRGAFERYGHARTIPAAGNLDPEMRLQTDTRPEARRRYASGA